MVSPLWAFIGAVVVAELYKKNVTLEKKQEWEREIDHVDISEVSFNQGFSNYCPVFYGGGLLFTSTRFNNQFFQKKDPLTDLALSVLYFSNFEDSSWTKVKPIRGEISRSVHYGPASLNTPRLPRGAALHPKR